MSDTLDPLADDARMAFAQADHVHADRIDPARHRTVPRGDSGPANERDGTFARFAWR
jgi:hypothetical protein